MQTRIKAFVFGTFALAGLFVAGPAAAQTYNQSYYYPQQYSGSTLGPSCPSLSYNLTLGTSDSYTQGQVSQLQRFLAGRYGDARLMGGYYGQLTSYYVSRFQREQGVYPVTGGVGPLTRAAIIRVCGGGYAPTPTPNAPVQSAITFRLDKNFSLSVGQTGQLRSDELTLKLVQIVTSSYGYGYYRTMEPTAVRITLTQGCRAGTYCYYAPSRSFTLEEDDTVTFEHYEIELISLNATRATFRVTEDSGSNNDNDEAAIEIIRPSGSQSVEQGEEIEIAWQSDDEPSDSSVIVDLYKSNGSKVGTIAISDDTDDSFDWNVPEGGRVCTQQFPNGLCGRDLEGRYYIKVSLVRGDGFDGGAVLDSDTSPTFEIRD